MLENDTVYLDNNFKITDNPTEMAIDKEIVDIIISLNEKGYKTIECCSGHYTEKIYYDFDYLKTLSASEDLKWINEHLLEIIKEDDKKYYCRGKIKGNNFCIFFDQGTSLPYYPKEFERRGNSVWHEIEFYHDVGIYINRKNKYEVEKEIETIHHSIRKWVENLPEL